MGVEELLNQGGDEEEVEEGAPAWMATFADMATLLMTFFVLLLSFANMDTQKFREMLGSVKDAFGVQVQNFGQYKVASSNVLENEIQQEMQEALESMQSSEMSQLQISQQSSSQAMFSMDQALSVIEALFEEVEGVEEVFLDERGITVRVEGKLMFPSGSDRLKADASPVLERVAVLMEKYTFDLYILGHTDPVPISTARFPSNWELSSARSTATLRHLLRRGGSRERLVAVGFADSRPIADNDTPEGRARNRRVEFLFKNPESLTGGGFKPADL